VITQAESRKSVDACGEIASVDGIDCVFIGPADLSAALGRFCQPRNTEVQEAIREVVGQVRATGKAVGILAPLEADAQHHIDMGIRLVGVGSDIGMLKAASAELRALQARRAQ
jgi:2-dehydro-3-deoxyglucarate aldolase